MDRKLFFSSYLIWKYSLNLPGLLLFMQFHQYGLFRLVFYILQKSADGGRIVSSSISLLNARDLTRPNKVFGLNYNVSCQAHTLEAVSKSAETITAQPFLFRPEA
jgi:hypothetical protein